MSDYGFRVTRDAGGKHSVPKTIHRCWDMDEARAKMKEAAYAEAEKVKENGEEKNPQVIEDPDTIELRHSTDGELIAFYEVEEFEQR